MKNKLLIGAFLFSSCAVNFATAHGLAQPTGAGNKKDEAVNALRRGMALSEKKEHDKAIAEFSEAIRLAPDYAQAFNGRGLAWATKRNFDKAIEDYNQAIKLAPNVTFIPYMNRGSVFRETMQFEKALADFDKAIELAPKRAEPYEARGYTWLLQNEIDKGIADLTEAIRFDPKLVTAYVSRSNAWLAKKDYDKAIVDQTEVIRLEPTGKRYRHRAGIWLTKKDYEKAIADYGDAIRLEPKDHMTLVILSRMLATLPEARFRDGKRALELAKKAQELDSNFPCLEVLAAAYAELGNFEEAIRWQEKAVQHPLATGLLDPSIRLKLYHDKKPARITP